MRQQNSVPTNFKIKGQLAWRYFTGVIGLKQSDIWLASFPRAGNTWVRFILCNMMSLSEMGGRSVDFHFLDATMPVLGSTNLFRKWPYQSIPRFVKTHQPYRQVLFAVPKRTVYILRDPRDVMVSYYHFQQAHLHYPFRGSFAEFIRHPHYGLLSCVNHYLSWLRSNTMVIYFEELHREPAKTFKDLFEALNISVDDELIDQAVERSSLNAMKTIETKKKTPGSKRFDPQFRAVRKGKPRQWPEYFSNDDLVLYKKICVNRKFEAYL